jgi:hypothetical protein
LSATHLCIFLIDPDLSVGHHPHHVALLPLHHTLTRLLWTIQHLQAGRQVRAGTAAAEKLLLDEQTKSSNIPSPSHPSWARPHEHTT